MKDVGLNNLFNFYTVNHIKKLFSVGLKLNTSKQLFEEYNLRFGFKPQQRSSLYKSKRFLLRNFLINSIFIRDGNLESSLSTWKVSKFNRYLNAL